MEKLYMEYWKMILNDYIENEEINVDLSEEEKEKIIDRFTCHNELWETIYLLLDKEINNIKNKQDKRKTYWDYIDLYKVALKDYEELKNRFEEDKELTLQELHKKYGGMNYEDCLGELFDLNYKHICATFVKDENGKTYLSETIEIYDDNDDCYGDFWVHILRKDIERFENGEIKDECE